MGVFVTRGMRVSIPAGGLTIGFDQSGASISSCRIEVGLSLLPIWLEIALHHLRLAHAAHTALVQAHASGDDKLKGRHLEAEFAHAMQSIVASATAIDAFYASIKDLANYSRKELDAMRSSRTARPARIKETARRVFAFGPESTAKLDKLLTTIYRFRDWAVHPPADQREPIYHPPVDAGVEWRFVVFSYSNARECLSGAMSFVGQLLKKGAGASGPVQKHCADLLPLVDPVTVDWASGFGEGPKGEVGAS